MVYSLLPSPLTIVTVPCGVFFVNKDHGRVCVFSLGTVLRTNYVAVRESKLFVVVIQRYFNVGREDFIFMLLFKDFSIRIYSKIPC